MQLRGVSVQCLNCVLIHIIVTVTRTKPFNNIIILGIYDVSAVL